jgi:hypothetical protein
VNDFAIALITAAEMNAPALTDSALATAYRDADSTARTARTARSRETWVVIADIFAHELRRRRVAVIGI